MKSVTALFPIQLGGGGGGDRKESITKDDKDTGGHGKGETCAVESTGQAQALKKVSETLHPSSTSLTKGS